MYPIQQMFESKRLAVICLPSPVFIRTHSALRLSSQLELFQVNV